MFPAGNREATAGEIAAAPRLRVGELAEEQVNAAFQSSSVSTWRSPAWVLANTLWSRCPADIQLNQRVCPCVCFYTCANRLIVLGVNPTTVDRFNQRPPVVPGTAKVTCWAVACGHIWPDLLLRPREKPFQFRTPPPLCFQPWRDPVFADGRRLLSG